jgi:hypothetical protein
MYLESGLSKEDANMTKPTFSILVDTEENTNLAIHQLTQIALEEGIITQEDLEKMDEKKKELVNMR